MLDKFVSYAEDRVARYWVFTLDLKRWAFKLNAVRTHEVKVKDGR